MLRKNQEIRLLSARKQATEEARSKTKVYVPPAHNKLKARY